MVLDSSVGAKQNGGPGLTATLAAGWLRQTLQSCPYIPDQRLSNSCRCPAASFLLMSVVLALSAYATTASAVVDRCNQENLLQQLKSDVRSLTAPVDNLLSNWAYMVMGSLAWSLRLGGLAPAGGGPLGEAASDGEVETVADGFPHVPCGHAADSHADRRDGPQDRLSLFGVESLATRLLPLAGSTGAAAALLTTPPRSRSPDAPVHCHPEPHRVQKRTT